MISLLEATSPTARKLLRGHKPKPVQNSPAMVVIIGAISDYLQTGGHLVVQYRDTANAFTHDDMLVWLVGATGDVTKVVEHRRRDCLLHVAAIVWAWLQAKAPFSDQQICAALAQERLRQRQLLRAGRFTLDVSSPVPDAARKLRVLVEEVGEVAEAIDQLEQKHTPSHRRHFLDELTQVLAVAVAWLESYEVAK